MAQSVRIRGVDKVLKNLALLQPAIRVGIRIGLRSWGEETMTVAKSSFVPVKTGNLRSSGRVANLTQGQTELVELSFGEGVAGEYAIPVHEIPARHTVGEDKYLEKPAFGRSGLLVGIVAREIREKTGISR